jgi:quercetin dioxygenase-like cupin family protein
MSRAFFAAASAASLLLAMNAAPAANQEVAPVYSALQGQVLLENDKVRVEKYLLAPGQSTGRHTRVSDQLLVFTKGGMLRSAAGRATLWRDGRVLFEPAGETADDGSTNVGSSPIEMIWVRLKQAPHTGAPARDYHLNYPNIPGEDLLENDRLVVQRFLIQPGQWEGVHAHRPNMLYIHVKGGQWGERTYKQPEHPSGPRSDDGSVGWMRIVDISEGHESRNEGSEPIDLIWVTLKD